MTEIRTRFAPSPTGFMHIGNLRTALYAYLFAKKHNGRFILRIEDTDQERLVDNAVAVIYNTLKLAGLSHDEGPDVGGEYGPYIQSERKSIYDEYAKKLIACKHAYHCFCTKERLETLTDDSGNRKYDKHCLHLSPEEVESKIAAGIPYVIRQNVPETGTTTFSDLVFGDITVENRELHDNVLIKSDGFPTYNFANVVDDHLMRISHVFRGMEYISSTPNYNLLYESFGWEIPQYVHLPHIMKDKQHKLSKRHGDANFEDFLEKGFLPEAILNYVALLGWNPKNEVEKFSLSELIESFEISGISKSSAVFDEVKLRWLNSQYVKELPAQEFHSAAVKYYADISPEINTVLLSQLLQTRVSTVSDIPDILGFINNFENYDVSLFDHKDSKSTKETAKNILPEIIAELGKIDTWENDVLFGTYIRVSEQSGVKKKALLWIIRIALTGHLSTPGGASEMCVLMGKNLSMKRLNYSLDRLESDE
ncbi:MAG: glutamate--tRNA ligase [Prevotellaceae bacterium]|jgi:glutamyl-tRNA synthetase|nr:glutamate--tRNA ligase [Prevotellaceae bacterium]